MNKSKKIISVVLAIAVMIAICVIPLALHPESEFGGADGAADELVAEIAPENEPWFSSLWEPPGSETESLLFALQAAIGSGIFCFCMGYFVATKKNKKEDRLSSKNNS